VYVAEKMRIGDAQMMMNVLWGSIAIWVSLVNQIAIPIPNVAVGRYVTRQMVHVIEMENSREKHAL